MERTGMSRSVRRTLLRAASVILLLLIAGAICIEFGGPPRWRVRLGPRAVLASAVMTEDELKSGIPPRGVEWGTFVAGMDDSVVIRHATLRFRRRYYIFVME